MSHDPAELGRHVGDAISVGVVVATIAQWLPAIAALMTVIWTAIRIYETKTVQRLLGRPAPVEAGAGGSDDD